MSTALSLIECPTRIRNSNEEIAGTIGFWAGSETFRLTGPYVLFRKSFGYSNQARARMILEQAVQELLDGLRDARCRI
jgi:hypothetical protein